MNTPLTLDHVAMPMYDVPATRRFYGEMLGLTLAEALSGDEWEGRAWLMLIYADPLGHRLALCTFRGLRRPRDPLPTDARHYALAAAGGAQLRTWKRRLAEAKVAFREEDHGTTRSIYFDDPNGNTLEITSSPTKPSKPSARADTVIDRWLAGA